MFNDADYRICTAWIVTNGARIFVSKMTTLGTRADLLAGVHYGSREARYHLYWLKKQVKSEPLRSFRAYPGQLS